MKTILVPIDFSDNADKALSAAKQIAAKTGAKLLIMYAYQPYIADFVIPEAVLTAPIYQQLEDDYRAELNKRVTLAQKEGYLAEAIWAMDGVESAVLKQARDIAADMIVVGRTGHGKFADRLFGSSATAIALHAPCPVLVVPPTGHAIAFEQIVYATQLEFDEKQTLHGVIELTRQLNGSLKLVKVNADEQLNIQPDRQFLDDIEREFGITRHDVTILKGDRVMETLERYCDKHRVDLLIVAHRHRDFLEKLLNPSMTKKLALDTRVPLLVYHQHNPERKAKIPMVILG